MFKLCGNTLSVDETIFSYSSLWLLEFFHQEFCLLRCCSQYTGALPFIECTSAFNLIVCASLFNGKEQSPTWQKQRKEWYCEYINVNWFLCNILHFHLTCSYQEITNEVFSKFILDMPHGLFDHDIQVSVVNLEYMLLFKI